MLGSRDYDLREDARSLVTGQWLRDGEHLRAFTPTGRGNYKSEIRGFPSPARKAVTVLGWSALKLTSPVGIVTGGVPYWNEIRRFEGRPPSLIAFGDGRSCEAATVLGAGPRRSGVWVLSQERFGFAGDRRVSPGPGQPSGALRRADTVVLLDKVIDVPSTRFAFEGDVARGDAVYVRIRFHDGSGVDLFNR